jgi:hypothetical protein
LLLKLKATGYWDLITGRDRGCILLYLDPAGSAACTASYSMGIVSYFLGDKANIA